MTITTHHFSAADGTQLAYHELGDSAARPLVLVHGLLSSANVNWIKYGHAALLAEAGYRVIMPDLRAHGASAAPHDAAAYPPDVLVSDGLALIAHLGLTDYDLGGFSLGGRTVARMLIAGAAPKRAMIMGMGLDGIVNAVDRTTYFSDVLANMGTYERGSEQWATQAFLKTTKADVVAMRLLLTSTVDTAEADIRAIRLSMGVICGDEDIYNAGSRALAGALPNARFTEIPGTHMSCVTKRELGEAIRDFLAGGA